MLQPREVRLLHRWLSGVSECLRRRSLMEVRKVDMRRRSLAMIGKIGMRRRRGLDDMRLRTMRRRKRTHRVGSHYSGR